MSDIKPCDENDKELCSLHPHNNQPCDGDCGDIYLKLTLKDWRADIAKSGDNMDSLRGGILLDEKGKATIKKIQDQQKDSST